MARPLSVMADTMRRRRSTPRIGAATTGRACPTCGQPEDLQPIQTAAVIGSLSRRYHALLSHPDPTIPARPAHPTGGCSALEHAAHAAELFATLNLRLRRLVTAGGHDVPVSIGTDPTGTEPADPALLLTRLRGHADNLVAAIVASTVAVDWQQAQPPDGMTVHQLVHHALDDATSHLHDAEQAIRDAAPQPSFPGSPATPGQPHSTPGSAGQSQVPAGGQ